MEFDVCSLDLLDGVINPTPPPIDLTADDGTLLTTDAAQNLTE